MNIKKYSSILLKNLFRNKKVTFKNSRFIEKQTIKDEFCNLFLAVGD